MSSAAAPLTCPPLRLWRDSAPPSQLGRSNATTTRRRRQQQQQQQQQQQASGSGADELAALVQAAIDDIAAAPPADADADAGFADALDDAMHDLLEGFAGNGR